jgi:hypothetical protein
VNSPSNYLQCLARPPLWLVGCITLAMGLLFVSTDSLWIDEGNAASKALQPSLASWYESLVSQGGSDAQMPGYMFYIWAWEKIFGSREFALRASNIPWLLVAIYFLRRTPFFWISLLVSPFVLYYINELRPYLMQIAGAAVIMSCFLERETRLESLWRKFLFGNLILCASSLTGVLWSAGALVSFLAVNPTIYKNKPIWRDLAIAAPPFLLLGAYSLKTLLLGQGAAQMGGGLVLSLAACAYELTGLMGLGPGRIELRENPRSVIQHALPLAGGVLVFGSAYLAGFVTMVKGMTRQQLFIAAMGLAIPLAILFSLVILKDFRLLARHLAPLSILLALALASLLSLSAKGFRFRQTATLLACMVISLGIVSAVSLRLGDRHKKDAYRDASTIAKAAIAEGREVFWAADGLTAAYYGLQVSEPNFQFINLKYPLPEINKPDLIIMSKPDIVDPKGNLRSLLKAQNFEITDTLQAFTIWEISNTVER